MNVHLYNESKMCEVAEVRTEKVLVIWVIPSQRKIVTSYIE